MTSLSDYLELSAYPWSEGRGDLELRMIFLPYLLVVPTNMDVGLFLCPPSTVCSEVRLKLAEQSILHAFYDNLTTYSLK